MRKEGLENLVLTGKIEGSRGRGRPRETYMSSLCKWMREQLPEDEKGEAAVSEVLRATKDRSLWKAMIVKALKGQGT